MYRLILRCKDARMQGFEEMELKKYMDSHHCGAPLGFEWKIGFSKYLNKMPKSE